MKSVLFIRHAKSSWNSPLISDFDRPLDPRGKKDAPEMAKRLLGKTINIDAIISSPAKRARKTALIFGEVFSLTEKYITFKNELYLPANDIFYDVIEQADNQFKQLAIFSHNPGITDFVNTLTDEIRVDNMPTCGIFAIQSAINSWKDLRNAEKKFWFFDYPKLHQ